MLNKFRLEE